MRLQPVCRYPLLPVPQLKEKNLLFPLKHPVRPAVRAGKRATHGTPPDVDVSGPVKQRVVAAGYLSIRPLPETDERRVGWGKISGYNLLSLAGNGQR